MIRKYAGKYLYPIVIGLIASLLAGLAVNTVSWLGHLELRTNQQRLVKSINVQPSNEVILIQIKEDTPGLLGLENQTLPIPRRFHAQLIDGLKRAQARGVVFDLVFSGHSQTNDDNALRQALESSSPISVTLAAKLTSTKSDPGYPTGWQYSFAMPDILPDPLPSNVVIASPVVFNPGNKLDGAVLMMPNAASKHSLPYLAFSAALSRLGEDVADARWDMSRGLVTAGRSSYPVGQDGELHAIWTKEAFKQIEYSEALRMLSTADGLKEFNRKIVVVGISVMGEDTHVSPIGEIYGMAFVGQMLNTLLQPEITLVNRWRIPSNTIWACLLAFTASALILTLRPRIIIAGLPVCIAIALLFPSLMLGIWYIWVDTVGPLLAIGLSAILSVLFLGIQSSERVQRFIPGYGRKPRLIMQNADITEQSSNSDKSQLDKNPDRIDQCVAFISYRRDGGSETARSIREALRNRNILTFLDVEDLRSHLFDERLLNEIESVPNFIVILSPGCLVRCNNEGDWLRREIEHAIKTNRNIIPIMKDGFCFPPENELPSSMVKLTRYNGVPYSHEFFSASLDKLELFLE